MSGGVEETANQFRDALSRLDHDGTGVLSFEDFSRGLLDVGLNLPREEVVTIWEEAGGAAPPSGNAQEGRTLAAGRPNFVADALVHAAPPQNFYRKQVEAPHLALHANLAEGLKPRGDAEIGGPDGRYSHKKVGYQTGNISDSLQVDGGMVTTKSHGLPRERRRLNLEPAGEFGDALVLSPRSPTRPSSPQRSPTRARESGELAEAVARLSHGAKVEKGAFPDASPQ
eukprot:CAMPEP_0180178200 /NCGR_PEP_ID=MMETSP0986-20121125/38273_1 /TAXON_ID=697907 /ORGANISM="non described non described, Strain CCMP2293" /LENGTH=226 /DNA_ID=CAMNT_0022131021 /DNA_START=11 /DNA_END=688 /DNA_ORIENTATION=+